MFNVFRLICELLCIVWVSFFIGHLLPLEGGFAWWHLPSVYTIGAFAFFVGGISVNSFSKRGV
jgi:hypothetical protein